MGMQYRKNQHRQSFKETTGDDVLVFHSLIYLKRRIWEFVDDALTIFSLASFPVANLFRGQFYFYSFVFDSSFTLNSRVLIWT